MELKALSDNAMVPILTTYGKQTDYQDYLEWVAQGNTTEEAD
jgi:hypothetical protein